MLESEASALINACFSSLSEAAELLQAKPELLESRTGLGETALHYLAVEDQLHSVSWLIERGASVNVVNDVGTTPLSDAASLGYFEMVELLLLHGAQSDVPTGNALLSAVHCGNARVVGLILDAGADPNAPTEGNETALHAAAARSDAQQVIRVLVEAGANMEARYFDETPLDVALRLGHNQVAQTLQTLCLNSQARL